MELLLIERNHYLRGLRVQRPLRAAGFGPTLGVTHVRYPYNSPRLPVDVSHPRYVLDHNRCILCSRCVRVCDEIEGANVGTSAAAASARAWWPN